MKKTSIIFIIIFTVALLSMMFIHNKQLRNSKRLQQELLIENQELKASLNKNQLDMKVLETDIMDKRDQIDDIQREYEAQKMTLSEILTENETLKSENSMQRQEIEGIEETVIQYQNEKISSDDLIESYLEKFSRINEVLLSAEALLFIGQSETSVVKLWGQPLTTSTSINDGSGIWYLEGLTERESEYSDFRIIYRGDANGENMVVVYIESRNRELKTLRGIGVGNSLKELKKIYSEIEFGDTEVLNHTYASIMSEFGTRIYFIVENGLITRMDIVPKYP